MNCFMYIYIMRQVFRLARSVHFNYVIRSIIFTESLFWGTVNLLDPIIPLFIAFKFNFTEDEAVEIVALGMTIYFVAKSITEIPVAFFTDNIKGLVDEGWVLVFSPLVRLGAIAMLLFVNTKIEFYIIFALFGISYGISYAPLQKVFAAYVSDQHESFEWSVFDIAQNVAMALSAAVGGFLAIRYGFEFLFYSMLVIFVLIIFLRVVMLVELKKSRK